MDTHTLAYLAGCMDSDGSFGIKRSTYHMRVRGDATQATYSERIDLRQVTPQVPHLLKETFGGYVLAEKPGTSNSKPGFAYHATDLNASKACALLLPYLRIKQRQAEIILELRETKQAKYWQNSYWFQQEYPNWRELEMITRSEAAELMGCKPEIISQAIGNGNIIALPWDHTGIPKPRIPRLLIERLASVPRGKGGTYPRPTELMAWRTRLYQQIKELNKVGVNGTPLYHLTGPYTPAK